MLLLVLFTWGLQPSFGSPPSLCDSTLHFSGPLAQQKREFIEELSFYLDTKKSELFPELLAFPKSNETLLLSFGFNGSRNKESLWLWNPDSFTLLKGIYDRLTQLESRLHLSPLRFVFRGKTSQGKTVLWNPFPDEIRGEWIDFDHGGDIVAPQEISFGQKENQVSDYYLDTEHFMRLFAQGIVVISHDKLLTHDFFGHVIPRILYPQESSYYQGMLFRFFKAQGTLPLTDAQKQGLFYLDEINSFSIDGKIKEKINRFINKLDPKIKGLKSRKDIFQILNQNNGSDSFLNNLKILAKNLSGKLPELFHYYGGYLNDGLNADHVAYSYSAFSRPNSFPLDCPRYMSQLLTPLGSVREFIRLVDPHPSRKIAAELVPLALFHLSLFLTAYNHEISLNDNLINGLYSVLYREQDPYFKSLYEDIEFDFIEAAPPNLKHWIKNTLSKSKSPEKAFPLAPTSH